MAEPGAESAIETAARAERAAVLAAVARDTRDLALAEDAVQEAFLAALAQWPRQGRPERPGAWLTTVARRAALRELRRRGRDAADPELVERLADVAAPEPDRAPAVPDAQLELLFACCHPALSLDAQVALTLRTVGGLGTAEIANAFLVPRATLAQRLVRAQNKVRSSGIPFAVPEPGALPERLAAILGVIYLIFTEGHTTTGQGARVRVDLCEEACRLARLVAVLLPDEPEALGLCALVLAHDARRPARLDAGGRTVPLDQQDRDRYDQAKVAEATGLLDRALACARPGPYQVEAAIAILHARAPHARDTDWQQIALLYRTLAAMTPSPVIALNHAAAVGMAEGPAAGLSALDALSAQHPQLEANHRFHASRAALLQRDGRGGKAVAAYTRALALVPAGSTDAEDVRRELRRLQA